MGLELLKLHVYVWKLKGGPPNTPLKQIKTIKQRVFKRFQCSNLNRQHAAEGGGGSRKEGSVIYHFCQS